MSREFEELESKLRQALRRESAPPDFVAGVMARVASEKVVPISWWRRKSAGLAIAATLLLAAVVPVTVVERQKQQRAEDAHRQLVEALRITRTRLDFTKQKMVRKGS